MADDHLTIAYIAIGAANAIAERGHDAVADIWRGPELELIAEVIAWARLLDVLAESVNLDGCFAYEVAQPFGEELTRALLTDSQRNTREIAPVIAFRLVQEASSGTRRWPVSQTATCRHCGRSQD